MSQADLRYRMGKNGTTVCPVCGCAVEDAIVHTAYHQSIAIMVSEAMARQARRDGR